MKLTKEERQMWIAAYAAAMTAKLAPVECQSWANDAVVRFRAAVEGARIAAEEAKQAKERSIT